MAKVDLKRLLYTDEQYIALNKLIDAICSKYPQIKRKLLDEEKRYNFFHYKYSDSKSDIKKNMDLSDELLSWRGISSHINYNHEKFDIGPAFNWHRLVKTPVCNPIVEDEEEELVPLRLYANTELAGKGGYFPIGGNHALYTGVHLFGNKATQEVRAMAPGYVVAFRFYDQLETKNDIASLGLHHSKTASFVMLWHEVEIPKSNSIDVNEYSNCIEKQVA